MQRNLKVLCLLAVLCLLLTGCASPGNGNGGIR